MIHGLCKVNAAVIDKRAPTAHNKTTQRVPGGSSEKYQIGNCTGENVWASNAVLKTKPLKEIKHMAVII